MMQKRKNLIEKIGVQIERRRQLAPLAARILAYLILKDHKGETFENLVEGLCASKSTISTHLSSLQATHQVTYYTKPGDRKKYFILSPDALIREMNETIEGWEEEKEMHQEIAAYKKEFNEAQPKNSAENFDLDFHFEYMNYLDQATKLIKNLQAKLIKNHPNK